MMIDNLFGGSPVLPQHGAVEAAGLASFLTWCEYTIVQDELQRKSVKCNEA